MVTKNAHKVNTENVPFLLPDLDFQYGGALAQC